MLKGLGTDILEIERIERSMAKMGFMQKVFTENEIKYIESHRYNRYRSAAGIFCAKEAFVKALGVGLSGLSMLDIEIYHDDLGKPYIRVFNYKEEVNAMISISHSELYATAVAIIL